MSKGNFQKFIRPKESGARLKETIRQEKKKARKETQAYFEQKKRERTLSAGKAAPARPATKGSSSNDGQRAFSPSAGRPGSFQKTGTSKTLQTSKTPRVLETPRASKASRTLKTPQTSASGNNSSTTLMPLNKFISQSGLCSRRDAALLVKEGKVQVNGEPVTEPGFKVSRQDEVRVQGKKVEPAKKLVYILLNKPKDHITTTEDPQGRKTVMDIVKAAADERLYPVGRLDRNTTGVLLLTNDGELTQKLSHPSYEVKKIYEVTLDRPLTKSDFDELASGLQLEDGFIAPDSLAYTDPKNRSVIGIEIHSGRNRIVRRMFEKLGYDVRNLDRVMYANLTKKNVERGKWRFLQEKEIRLLKFMNASYGKRRAATDQTAKGNSEHQTEKERRTGTNGKHKISTGEGTGEKNNPKVMMGRKKSKAHHHDTITDKETAENRKHKTGISKQRSRK